VRQCPVCGVSYEAELGRLDKGKDLHCSKACAFPGPVDRSCEKCGAAFTANRSEIAKGWGRFCSNECRRTRVERICATCGLPFEVVASQATDERGKYCSNDCRHLGTRNRVKRECVICGTPFEKPVSTITRTAALYCSRDCLTLARRTDPVMVARCRKMQRGMLASKGPTGCERNLYALLDEVVGEGMWSSQYLVFDKWTVDAALPNLHLVIQADGDYWHGYDPKTHTSPMVAKNRSNDRRQGLYMKKARWHLLRLWEHDLKLRPEWCADQIRQYVSLATSQPPAGCRGPEDGSPPPSTLAQGLEGSG
jgi:very-short-patch-repair endonuclease